MDDDEVIAEHDALPVSVGDRLRAAREAKGLGLDEVAAETRIAKRHLEQIEAGKLEELPGRTYAVGFSRSYAKLLELDDDEIARDVRAELASYEQTENVRPRDFEPGDPARVPSARLAWISAFAGIAIFAAGCVFLWSSFIAPAGRLPALGSEEAPAAVSDTAVGQAPAELATSSQPPDQVIFTALEEGIWVKFYERGGAQLMQKQMSLGETYTVPAGADGPLLWTGRPDALKITVGGNPVPKLSETDRVMKDVPVTADALLVRQNVDEAASPTA